MKLMNRARATDARADASARVIEHLKTHLSKQARVSSAALDTEMVRQAPYQELVVPGHFRALAVEATIVSLCRKEDKRVAVIRCVEDCPGLRPMEVPYGAEHPPKSWMLPEREEPPRDFLARVLSKHKLDFLVVQNAVHFARLCRHSSFQDAEPLWVDLAAMAATAKCQVALIRYEN